MKPQTPRPGPGGTWLDQQQAMLDLEAFKRLRHAASLVDVQVMRTDGRDGPVSYVTTHRGRDLRRHESETKVREYLGSLR